MKCGNQGCHVYSFRAYKYVWKPQEAAQDSSARPPDHFLLVQYPSEHFTGCVTLAADAASGALVLFQLQCSRLTMQADSSNINIDGL